MNVDKMDIAKGFLEKYVATANDVIFLKLIRSQKDIEDDLKCNTFHPEFTHQFFGENEKIFGYRGLKIRLYYSSSNLTRFISMNYDEKISPKLSEGVSPDDVLEIMTDKMEGDYQTSMDKFSAAIEESSFKPFGQLLNQFKSRSKEDEIERVYEVYKADMSIAGFKDYHHKIRTFLLWFIDGASYIDEDDDRWDYFVLYEKSTGNGLGSNYHFAGFTTVYRYFAYPMKTRPRISQVLVLPPFQRQGLGAELLQAIYNYYISISDVLDITVEDPSDNFVRLRDYVDCKNCRKLASFSKSNLAKGWQDDMADEAQNVCRLNKKQSRRVYEILKLASIDRSNEEMYKAFRLEVKKRLNAPFAKLNRSTEKAFSQAAATKEMRMEELRAMYEEVEDEYLQTIDKLATV
ncbi:Histone acetyltransferase type B catalytic subunit [Halotydeus destructor]|nr:Histone acetyltransferase type B catalytic subunit [Halotydeus destructor]